MSQNLNSFPAIAMDWAALRLEEHASEGHQPPRSDRVEHVAVWLEGMLIERPSISQVFPGMSWIQAEQAADARTTLLRERSAYAAPFGGKPNDVMTVLELDNGYRWVRILTPEAMTYEAAVLQHGMGPALFSWPQLHSLRDELNRPHCTVCWFKPGLMGRVLSQGHHWRDVGTMTHLPSQYHPMLIALIRSLEPEFVCPIPGFPYSWSSLNGQAPTLIHWQDLKEGDRVDRLALRSCIDLSCLPHNLTVDTSLDLSNNHGTSLPRGLKVGSLVDLRDCPELEEIPDDLSCGSFIIIQGCKALKKGPPTGTYPELAVHQRIEELKAKKPEIRLVRDLGNGYRWFEIITPDDDARGMFAAKDSQATMYSLRGIGQRSCRHVHWLPETQSISEKFWLGWQWQSSEVTWEEPEQFERHTAMLLEFLLDLKPTNLAGLYDFPYLAAAVNGKPPSLVHWKDLRSGDRVEGDVLLVRALELDHLPTKLTFIGNLSLTFSKGTKLPHGLIVAGSLNLEGCQDLIDLPSDIDVGGHIDLTGCENFSGIPFNFTVKGDFILNGCHALQALPPRLVVQGKLSLVGCTSLSSLPQDLMAGTLDITGCTGLGIVPHLPGCTHIVRDPGTQAPEG